MTARARLGTRLRLAVAALAAGAALLSGCSIGLESLPAPPGTTGPTYRVTAVFRDVQNLTLGAKVKLGGVVVGVVTSIKTADYHALVGMRVEKRFPLGVGTRLQIRFTTPLGEDFISIISRGSLARGRLRDRAVIPDANTRTAPGIEDTFAALSTLLNGGGLDKLQIIARELDAAFKGRSGDARDALIKLHAVVANLDAHKDDIDRTLDGLGRLAQIIDRSTGEVREALDLFPDTLRELSTQTHRERELLSRLSDLGGTIDGLLRRSQDAMLADFDNLRPTLDALRARQNELLPTFHALITLGRSVRRAAPGDYLNISATIQFLLDAQPAHPPTGGVVRPGTEPHDAVHRLLTGGRR
jgi:phospholipid/cholesterol/gamma-HCH transport system substrate-binding protein